MTHANSNELHVIFGSGAVGMAVMAELVARGLVRSTLVLTPPHLQEQWQGELSEKFHERSEVYEGDTDLLRADRVILSHHAARGQKGREEGTRGLAEAARLKSSVFQSHEETLQKREQMWQALIAGRVPVLRMLRMGAAVEPDMMELGLTSRWHHGHPYNDQCPYLTNTSERALVGCQGTAFSQIMYYWKWPTTGMGSKTITYDYRFRTNWDSQPLSVNPKPSLFPGVWRGRLDWSSGSGGRLWMTGSWDHSIYSSARNLSTNVDYLTALEALYNRLTSASSILP